MSKLYGLVECNLYGPTYFGVVALYEIDLEEINQSYRGWLELERGPLLALPFNKLFRTTFKFKTSLVTDRVIQGPLCILHG